MCTRTSGSTREPDLDSNIRNYQGISPKIHNSAYIDPTAVVIGDVSIGAEASVWPMAVLRGDVNRISIGHHTNIQDGSVLHVTHAATRFGLPGAPLTVGDYVTVGHKALLHACSIGNYCLIGMGAIIMDQALVPDHVFVGAGSLVSQGKQLQSGHLYLGNPARKVRELNEQELEFLEYSALHYVEVKNRHRDNYKTQEYPGINQNV